METKRTEPGDPDRARPKLLDRVRDEIRRLHYSSRTERAYVGWIRRYILYHGKRHPDSMGKAEIAAFLTHLTTERHVSASTQNQALSALLFLYHRVLGTKIPWIEEIERPQRPQRLPVVLTPTEVRALLSRMSGTTWLMAALLYGAGLRVLECARLRVKDVDLSRKELIVRDGKGRKDRVTLVPGTLVATLTAQLERVQVKHRFDLRQGGGFVELPYALRRKYPQAARQWGWQWVFPATRTYLHPETRERRRHHLDESVLQRAVRQAVREAGIAKPATCHTLRHYAGTGITGTRLPQPYSKTVTTFARSRNFSDIET